ncbi:MAG TPA: divalent-cation tolerance protein CutA [Kribbellaceae bacterium]|nr:divalent-cation tolerance protein CutA [Kribbellaceae bacterium]
MTDHLVAITTTDDEQKAGTLASGMVDARVAACVQIIGPIRSVYRWEGKIEDEREWQLWIKTTADRLDELKVWIKDNHDYDEPELVALPVIGGSEGYLKWVTDETRPDQS